MSTALEPCELSGGTLNYQPTSARAMEERSLMLRLSCKSLQGPEKGHSILAPADGPRFVFA